jgi:hypothetical protein
MPPLYPVVLEDTSKVTRIEGDIEFTALQPGGGSNLAYVTMQAMPPVGPFQTPLVHDSTAVTGGLYVWDGAAYQQVTTGP